MALLGACALFVACGSDPEPQHPTTHVKKKHKKHHTDEGDSDSVVISDDSGDDAPKKVATTTDDDEPKKAAKKHAKKSDDDDSKKDDESKKSDDDEPKKVSKKHAKKSDDDESKKSDDDEPKKVSKKHGKKSDDDESKKSDDDEPKKTGVFSKKSDDDEPPKKVERDDSKAEKTSDDEPIKAEAAKTDEEPKKVEDAPKPKKPVKTAKATKHRSKRTTPKKTPAPADDAGEIEMDEEPATGSPETTADAGTDDSNQVVAAAMPAPPPAPSPLSINDRALVTRHGAVEVHGGLRTLVLTLPTATPGMTTTSTAEGLALGATYGIADKAEIGADYLLSLSPGSIKGPLTLHGAYLAKASPKLDAAVAAALAVDFLDSTDPTTMKTTTTTSAGLQIGGWVRYRATSKVAVFTGLPALPASTASLSKLSFALPPLPYQLAVGLTKGAAISLDLPAGVGYQAAPAIYVFAMTNLAHVKVSNTANAFLFVDFIPVALGGFYSRDKLDLGATLGDDLKQGLGYLNFELVARYAL